MKLARVFSDYMVLQRKRPICVWGTCNNAKTISVRLNGKNICTAELVPGKFSFQIPAQEAMEDALLEIGDVQFHHVDIGEVWVAGGQSNMEFMLQFDHNGKAEMDSANDLHLRTYTVGQYSFPGEREMGYKAWNPWDRWVPFTTEHAKELPAVAIYFAKELRQQGVPVGILNCSWGGTSAAAWMSKGLLEGDPELRIYTDEFATMAEKLDMDRFRLIRSIVRPAMASPDSQKMMHMILQNTFHPAQLQTAMMAAMEQDRQQTPSPASQLPGGLDLTKLSQAELMQEGPGDKSEPGSLYENMLKEILGYSVQGIIWYQGESDETKATLYAKLFATLIDCWRNSWQMRNPAQQKLPFLFVQLAPYGVWMNNTSKNYPELRRQQQIVADTMADVYMVSITDVGNVYDIHPKQKQPIGHRLGLLARKHIYGESSLMADAPRAVTAKRTEDLVCIRFSNGDGLHIVARSFDSYNGFPLSDIYSELIPPVLGGICGLEVIADGRKVSNAECTVALDQLYIRSDEICNAQSVKIRFAQTPFYQVNLYNSEENPVAPFELNI